MKTDTQTDNCNSVPISQQLQKWQYSRYNRAKYLPSVIELTKIIQQVKELEEENKKLKIQNFGKTQLINYNSTIQHNDLKLRLEEFKK